MIEPEAERQTESYQYRQQHYQQAVQHALQVRLDQAPDGPRDTVGGIVVNADGQPITETEPA